MRIMYHYGYSWKLKNAWIQPRSKVTEPKLRNQNADKFAGYLGNTIAKSSPC